MIGAGEEGAFAGGCQCGAVRFRASGTHRSSICHCRMCQKQFGSFFGPFATFETVVFTRGAPKRFRSSSQAQRGFCADCGTPLTYERDGTAEIALAVGAFDDPAAAAPTLQVNPADRLALFDGLSRLPVREDSPERVARRRGIVSFQHPDRDDVS